MVKAYDRIEWCFLEQVLHNIGFPDHWTNLVMKCVTTVSFSVLLNGVACEMFRLERGLR